MGSVRLKWWGVLYLNFHFLQFAVNSLGGWMCAVGILSFTLLCFVVVSRGLLIFQVVDLDNLFQDVFGSSTS